MTPTQNFTEFEKAFYSDGYKLGMQAVEVNLSTESLYLSISKMYSAADELISSITQLALQQNQPIECKKGCDFCCHQPVYALDYEMQFLNTFIKANFPEEEQREIKIRAKKNRDFLKDTNKTEILNSKQPCPLLRDDTCSVYEARPMACRIYLSTNVNTCKIFYKQPENKTNYPALMDFPMRAGRMMNEGFKSALKTKNIIAKEFRIDELLLQ
jgi:Fe-S-cluster containining protein